MPFNNEITQLTTQTRNYAGNFNKINNQLLENTLENKKEIEALKTSKVDKVVGKGLSTNDYTTSDKTKLDGIATGANNYIHPSTHPASIITQDSSNRFVTDAEKSTWNGKADANHNHDKDYMSKNIERLPFEFTASNGGGNSTLYYDSSDKNFKYDFFAKYGSTTQRKTYTIPNMDDLPDVATSSTKGLMSSSDKIKIDGIEAGANNYVHPSNSNTRHVTDAEKATWNGKANASHTHTKANISDFAHRHNASEIDGLGDLGGASSWDEITGKPSTFPPSSHSHTKADVGLSNVDNTSDLAKPISTAVQNALNGKASTAVASTTANGLMSKEDKAKLNGIATGANNYVHPTTSGNKHIPSGGASGQILRWSADGTAVWGADNNTTYGVVSKTANGLAPKLPNETTTTKYLRQDGTWAVPPNTTYGLANPSTSGLMSNADKSRLDELYLTRMSQTSLWDGGDGIGGDVLICRMGFIVMIQFLDLTDVKTHTYKLQLDTLNVVPALGGTFSDGESTFVVDERQKAGYFTKIGSSRTMSPVMYMARPI